MSYKHLRRLAYAAVLLALLFVVFVRFRRAPAEAEKAAPAAEAPIVTPVPDVEVTPEPEPEEEPEPDSTPEADSDPGEEPSETVYYAFDDTGKNVGIYMNEIAQVKELEIQPDILAWFQNWFDENSVNKLAYCAENRITPMISWQPDGLSLDRIAAGEYDEYLREFFRVMYKDYGDMDILIRLAHEMEMRPFYRSWYSWQYWGGEPSYVAMWVHVVSMGRELAPNVKWIWSPNRIDRYSAQYYPGDEYVDYLGITLNHPKNNFPEYDSFEIFYKREGVKERVERYDKKIIFAETAYSSWSEEKKAAYLQSMFDYVRDDPVAAGLVYFDYDLNPYKMYRISNDSTYMGIYYDGVRSLRNEQ